MEKGQSKIPEKTAKRFRIEKYSTESGRRLRDKQISRIKGD